MKKAAPTTAPMKIQTTKDQKLEILTAQKKTLLLQQQAEQAARDLSAVIDKVAKEQNVDQARYGFHADELDFWERGMLQKAAQQAQIQVLPRANGAAEKASEAKP